ncbi:MAG: hypothetical protein CMM15_16295 [Rhodospirillaceae bacterium]|nr:hypothetical protein [Rhodospirillaceae bacterium]|tara:strand:- start:5639 stop:5983 length:345 start_codon:yes stop_codon:yes gene_type:complete
MDSIQQSVITIQSNIFDERKNMTDGQNVCINNELLNIYVKNQERNSDIAIIKKENRKLMKEKLELESILSQQKKIFSNPNIVEFVASKNGKVLQFVSKELQDNREIVLSAVRQS